MIREADITISLRFKLLISFKKTVVIFSPDDRIRSKCIFGFTAALRAPPFIRHRRR